MSAQKTSCYHVVKGLDDVLAKEYGDMNTRVMAGYRTIFEESKGIMLDKGISDELKEELFRFIEYANKQEKKKAAEAARRIDAVVNSKIFQNLRKTFPNKTLEDRLSMIARILSSRVTDYANANPTLTREEIIEQVGLLNLVKDSRDLIVGMINGAKANNDRVRVKELIKVLNNWSALVYMSQPLLRQYENINADISVDFVLEATEENYNENEEGINLEESVREQYQIDRDKESSFGTIGKEVRRALSRIPLYDENGNLSKDDLGITKTMAPIKVHQMLLDILRNVTSSLQMERVLQEYAVDNPWAAGLVQEIKSNPVLRTQLFVDLYKNFQMYSDQKTEDGKVKTRILNLEDSRRQYRKYEANILLGNFSSNSIFRKVNDEIGIEGNSLKTVRSLIQSLFYEDKEALDAYNKASEKYNRNRSTNIFSSNPRPIRPKTKFDEKKHIDKVVTLTTILSEYLGLSVDADMLNVLLNNKKDTRNLIDSLKDLSEYGLSIKNLDITASSLFANENFSEKINKILRILTKYNNGLALDSRIRYRGNTYYSNVAPSYLGDFIGYIQNCAKNNDERALQQFILNKFLNCPTFMRSADNKILNKWIEELLNSTLSEGTSFADNFSWKKSLGIDDVDFENFGENRHIQYLMTEFHSGRDLRNASNIEYISKEEFDKLDLKHRDTKITYFIEGTDVAYKYSTGTGWKSTNRNDYAWYPCFIMGDANVAKFIKAKRYSKNEILEGMYNIYLAEVQRQNEAKKLKAEWERAKISPNENMLKNMDKFCMLPFLNETYKGSHSKYYDIVKQGNGNPYAIKQAIEVYLEDSSKEFADKMQAKGIIKESEVGRAVDFFYNTSFATLNQLQLMTVDVAYYKDMKDLQKRYKEIHAPGAKLDIHAIDPWNNNQPILSEGDTAEKVVYFKEIKTDSEKVDPEFYKALVQAFGKNDWRTALYKKNKSTDGQGYRSFSSYRKVMIMAGKWNNECERAYNTIMSIREAMKREGRKTPTIEELNDLDNCKVVFQPIKPYLFGLETIQGSNMLIPVQHKYAEVPLIPELLPENSKLRELAEYMENKGIDLACSTEVVKVGEYGSVDITENINSLDNAIIHKLNYSDFRIQTNVPNHVYHSRLFGTQFRKLILSNLKRDRYDDYIDDTGVVITSGGSKVPLTKSNLIKFYNSLIVANILDSFKEFQKIAGDKFKLSKSAIQQILNNDRLINDNILAMSINEFNDFVIPLFEGGIEHEAASMLFSIYKKLVNKQSILGGSAVQVSDFGINGYEENDHLRFVTEEIGGKINIKYAECEIPFNFSYTNSKGEEIKLKFTDYCNPDGSFIMVGDQPKIEKEFPGILDIIAYRIPTERAYSMMNLKVVRCSHPMAGGTIKVPSQGPTIAGFDFDVDKLYFMRKEFKQKGRYNQIEKKIPSDVLGKIWRQVYDNNPQLESLLLEAKAKAGTNKPLNQYWDEAISGTTLEDEYSKEELFEEAAEDLNIDLDQYTEKRKFDSYNFNISPFEQSVTARNNMILELSRKRLEDYETFEERLTPGGFRNPSRAARLMRELLYGDNNDAVRDNSLNLDEIRKRAETGKDSEPEYDPSNPMTIIAYNKQNQIASKLIGIFANHNTHHSFISSLAECKFVSKIGFGSHPEGLNDLLHAPNGADTFLSMAEYLASSVDAVKDPVLNFLNLNTLTADSGALLSRLGYSFEEIGLLFNQPILRELCEYCIDNNINDISNGINEIASRHKINLSKQIYNPYSLSVEKLAYNVSIKGEDDIQAQVLKLFSQVSTNAKELSQFILNSKFTAANSVSSTFGDAFEKMDRLVNYINRNREDSNLIVKVNDFNDAELSLLADEYTLGSEEYLRMISRNPMAFEQVMSDCNLAALKFFSNFVPYNNSMYSEPRKLLASFTRANYLNGDVINNMFRDLPVYLLSNDDNSMLNPNRLHETGSTNKEYYLNIFPNKLYNYLRNHKELRGYNLFKYLSPNIDKDGKFYLAPQDTGGIGTDIVDLMRGEWMSLYNNEDTKWIVEGIFNYSFYTVGFNFNHNSFINLVPTEFKLNYKVAEDYEGNPITYVEYLNNILKDKNGIDSYRFADLFIRNHPNESSLIYSPKGKLHDNIESQIKENDSQFTVMKMGSRDNSISPLILRVEDNIITFRPYIKIGDALYRANGSSFNKSITGEMTYKKISILGDTVNGIDYYDSEVPVGRKPEVRIDRDSPDTTSEGEAIFLTDEKLDELFIEVLRRGKADLVAHLQDPSNENYISDKAQAELTAEIAINEYISNIGSYSRKDKIDTIKAQANELLKGFKDEEGNPFC